jgi:hypothetical protein
MATSNPNQSMRLILSAEGVRRRAVPVADFSEASRAMREFVERNGLGASQLTGRCGEITAGPGGAVARVSYNGRVWDARPFPDAECLYPEVNP